MKKVLIIIKSYFVTTDGRSSGDTKTPLSSDYDS